jgi:hypothetical protein
MAGTPVPFRQTGRPGEPKGRPVCNFDVHYNEVQTVRERRSLRERVGAETYSYGACDDMHFSTSRLYLPLPVEL